MTELKKKRIVIASVLKPVNDTRMFGKIALSLKEKGHCDVHVIGRSASVSDNHGITTFGLGNFKRISFKRWLAPWKVFFKVLQLRPSLLIVTTHELLWVSLFARLLTRCKIIYDVQENYFLNILHTHSFPVYLRSIIALYVRAKELVASFFVTHFFIAEKAYARELSFVQRKFTVLENKVRKPSVEILRVKIKSARAIALLFSGTLSESTGVFKAIEIAKAIHDTGTHVLLTIAGYCSRPSELKKIEEIAGTCDYIQLVGGNRILSHEEIVREILNADAGIISYPPNASTYSAIPTKLYEYIAYRLPIILVNHEPWISLAEKYHGSIVFDPDQIQATRIIEELKSKDFYATPPGNDLFWESEEVKMNDKINSIMLLSRRE
jgi:glycosyltransferase involved in cell wall biosynthesis